MSLPELEVMISILSTKKEQLEAQSFLSQQQLLRWEKSSTAEVVKIVVQYYACSI